MSEKTIVVVTETITNAYSITLDKEYPQKVLNMMNGSGANADDILSEMNQLGIKHIDFYQTDEDSEAEVSDVYTTEVDDDD
ncbi:hypothetical protein [Lacticaseibacillus saniviri]